MNSFSLKLSPDRAPSSLNKSHIKIESVWDDIPAYNADIPPDQNQNKDTNDPNSHESLVGRVELMNLKKIELGINLDEPVHISMKEYTPSNKKDIDPKDRPYQHQFEWYEDYYSKVGEEIGNKVQIITHAHQPIYRYYNGINNQN